MTGLAIVLTVAFTALIAVMLWFYTNPQGTNKWFLNGELHREDGPAIKWGGDDKYWFFKSKHHRDGSKHWYLNGKPLTYEEFKDILGEIE